MLTDDRTGVFRVTVTRLHNDGGTGRAHIVDVAAGSWITALKAAADSPDQFEYQNWE